MYDSKKNRIIRDPNSYLQHWGLKGMKWGLRRFQNEDGSLTDEGRERYGVGERIKGAIDEAKLQAHLGGEEAKSALSNLKNILPKKRPSDFDNKFKKHGYDRWTDDKGKTHSLLRSGIEITTSSTMHPMINNWLSTLSGVKLNDYIGNKTQNTKNRIIQEHGLKEYNVINKYSTEPLVRQYMNKFFDKYGATQYVNLLNNFGK